MKKDDLYSVKVKNDAALGNKMKCFSTKIQGSIVPYDMINTRNFITVMDFTGLIKIRGLASWDIIIL